MPEPIQFPSAAVFYEAPVLDEEEHDCPFSCFCEAMQDEIVPIKADLAEIKAMVRNCDALLKALVYLQPVDALSKELAIAEAKAGLPWLVRLFM